MAKIFRSDLLWLPKAEQVALVAAACDSEPVRGLTHGFYKYPARFSPIFVRAVIETFTEPGDLVLDNHVGGGTTLVEAMATGRDAIGVDISALAGFVSSVKTRLLSKGQLDCLHEWGMRAPNRIDVRKAATPITAYEGTDYYRHLNDSSRWRLRKAIEQGLRTAEQLGSEPLEAFARCAVLRTGQWALDGRAKLPSLTDFRQFLQGTTVEMVAGARALRHAVKKTGRRPVVKVLNRSAIGMESDELLRRRSPRLVITSPPYPGVHVLYHRWQVDGRKEAPLPFMIAGRLDGAGSSHYTMGDRKYPELRTYFESVRASMASAVKLADKRTVFVQLVAFAEAEWQLPRYLEAMTQAGLREMFLPSLKGKCGGRIWRRVPGRRWYSDQRGATPGSLEVVLFHRLAF